MENKVLVFGHKNPDTDSICSSIVSEILSHKNGWDCVEARRLGNVNKETQYVLDYLGIEAPELLEKVEEGQQVLLVDHNEFNQSVEGIEKAEILGVTDHHRIANFETSNPLYYIAKPYGCTSTILFEQFKQFGHEIEKKEAILMASSIISDTLLLKSPTTTEYDKKALQELGKIANINVEEYGLEMLKAGTDLDDFSAEELINLDAKSMNDIELNRLDFKDIGIKQDDKISSLKELGAKLVKNLSDKFTSKFLIGLENGKSITTKEIYNITYLENDLKFKELSSKDRLYKKVDTRV